MKEWRVLRRERQPPLPLMQWVTSRVTSSLHEQLIACCVYDLLCCQHRFHLLRGGDDVDWIGAVFRSRGLRVVPWTAAFGLLSACSHPPFAESLSDHHRHAMDHHPQGRTPCGDGMTTSGDVCALTTNDSHHPHVGAHDDDAGAAGVFRNHHRHRRPPCLESHRFQSSATIHGLLKTHAHPVLTSWTSKQVATALLKPCF